MEAAAASSRSCVSTAKTQVQWHAHWDCSIGATGSSLFFGCHEAWRTLKEQEHYGCVSNDDTTEQWREKGWKEFQSILRAMLPADVARQFAIQRRSNGIAGVKVLWDSPESKVPDLTVTQAKEVLEHTKSLPAPVKEQAQRVLRYVEEASPRSMTTTKDDVQLLDEGMHFLVYTVGTLWLLHDLGVCSISMSPLPCDHGAPLQTLHLLIGLPVGVNSQGSVTPLAAAILKALSSSRPKPPSFTLRAVGVAVLDSSVDTTTCATSAAPSVRLLVGTTPCAQQSGQALLWKTDHLIHMEANLDDISAEALAFAVEVLLKNGAVDAWVAPIVMKKGRAAHTLHCLCHHHLSPSSIIKEQDKRGRQEVVTQERLLKLIFQHTTTLGIRIHRDLERVALHRSFVTVQTPYISTTRKGLVDVKLGYLGDANSKAVSVKAEFDHCRDISLETGIPIQQIAALAVQEAYKKTMQQNEQQNN